MSSVNGTETSRRFGTALRTRVFCSDTWKEFEHPEHVRTPGIMFEGLDHVRTLTSCTAPFVRTMLLLLLILLCIYIVIIELIYLYNQHVVTILLFC